MTQSQKQINIAILHSNKQDDPLYCKRLIVHLSQLQQEGSIKLWSNKDIQAGSDHALAFDEAIRSADILLLLLSADFLALDTCHLDEMMQALERHKQEEVRVVPIIVRSCEWQHSPFAYLQCLPRNSKPIATWSNQDEAFLSIAEELRKIIEKQQFPSPPLSSLGRQMRTRLLKQVRATWIKGVLEQSLHQSAWIDLHLQEQADALENLRWSQVLDRESHPLPVGTSIVEVYDEADGELLILGMPGSGKTTLLLQLACTLLDRAKADERHQMPVIFHLSSWAQQQKPFATWLVNALAKEYDVQRSIAQDWVDRDQVLPLLDGLDEVAKEARTTCVEQINNYYQSRLEKHGKSPIVVCCRSEEYTMLPTRAKLQHTVSILPLTDEQINTYLEQAGEPVKVLGQSLQEDAVLRKLARQPLMLNIFTLAYQKATAAAVPTRRTHEEMQRDLFAQYIDRTLQKPLIWKQELFLHWLHCIAEQLHQQQQSVLLLENLQPADWLSGPQQRLYWWSVRLFTGLFAGLLFGLLAELLVGPPLGLLAGLSEGLFAGVIIGLVTGLAVRQPDDQNGEQPEEQSSELPIKVYRFARQGDRIRSTEEMVSWQNILLCLLFGLIAGPIVSVGWMLINWQSIRLTTKPIDALSGSLLGGLFIGPFFGLIAGLSPNQPTERFYPSANEGIRRSRKNGLLYGLIVSLIVGPVLWLVSGQIPRQFLIGYLLVGLVYVLTAGLLAGLNAFVQHFVLRFWLWGSNRLPWNLVPFLDEAAERLLLRKVGGRYFFVHHLLMDYVASLDTSSIGRNTSQRPMCTNKPFLLTLVIIALTIVVIISSFFGVGIYLKQVNTYPAYLSGKGTLLFVDPLDSDVGSQWASTTDYAALLHPECQFTGGAYHVSESDSGYFNNCNARGIYSNFAFEVQLTITRGDCGGMTFRDDSNGHFYKFVICQDGSYRVYKYVSNSGSDAKELTSGSGSAIHSGLGQQNKIAVVANGSTMTFYVNERQLDQEQDSSYTSGSIALIADPQFGNGTDVAYSSARLWTL